MTRICGAFQTKDHRNELIIELRDISGQLINHQIINKSLTKWIKNLKKENQIFNYIIKRLNISILKNFLYF